MIFRGAMMVTLSREPPRLELMHIGVTNAAAPQKGSTGEVSTYYSDENLR